MRKLLLGALPVFLAGSVLAADIADLVHQLKTGDSDARRQAAKALGEAGAEAKSAAPGLAQALRDQDRFVRRFAAEALGKVGGDPQATANALAFALADRTKEVRQAAVVSLGSVGPAAVAVLIGVLNDGDMDAAVRSRAAEQLGKIGPAARSAIPDLIVALGSTGGKKAKKKGPSNMSDIRLEVVNALAEIATASDQNAIDALKDLATAKGNRDRVLKQAANQAARTVAARKPS